MRAARRVYGMKIRKVSHITRDGKPKLVVFLDDNYVAMADRCDHSKVRVGLQVVRVWKSKADKNVWVLDLDNGGWITVKDGWLYKADPELCD